MQLKEHAGEEEWDNFQTDEVLSPDISGKLWSRINKNAIPPKVHYSYFRWTAVAAFLLLVMGMSWYFIIKKHSAATVAITKNNTPQKMTLTLSDGSAVELAPNSTLSYPESFNSLKRDIILKGDASFTVAKDVAKPFSVYSNSVLITVLGTRFTVRSDDATKVILYEGRVMTKTPDAEYYLTPGDIFVFKKSAHIFHLEKDSDDGYLFKDYPLDVVFDQLQIIYNTKIIYNKAELGNRTFIGKIDKKDSLSHILRSITLLNKFDLHRQGDSLIISNSH